MALAQTALVASRLRDAHDALRVETVPFKTRGDIDQVSKLERHGGKGGAFVAEIREAMKEDTLNAAMHSLKDLPGDEEAPGLVIGAYLPRESAGDALVFRPGIDPDSALASGLAGMKIGTNAVRRAAFARRLWPDAEIIHYRGAADTRLRKLDEGALQQRENEAPVGPADALIMAESGLHRVGAAGRIGYSIPQEKMLPAVGQGVIAVECLAEDWETRRLLSAINDKPTEACVLAEREMLWILNGHCNTPIGGHAVIENETLSLRGVVLSEHGATFIEASSTGDPAHARTIGRTVGLALLNSGAGELIAASGAS